MRWPRKSPATRRSQRSPVALIALRLIAFGTYFRPDFLSQVPMAERTYTTVLLLGQGGSGKTHVINNVLRPAIEACFKPTDVTKRSTAKPVVRAVAFSHAQAYRPHYNDLQRQAHPSVLLRSQGMRRYCPPHHPFAAHDRH